MGPEVWLPRIVAALLTGGAIGLERQLHGRPAGLRTHILVSVGAALMTLAGIEVAAAVGAATRFDASRIAAGVVTGIGFLGTGAIIRTKDLVRGLTTAACIWFAAGAGIACGTGMIIEASVATIVALAVLVFLGFAEERLPRVTYRDLSVVSESTDPGALRAECAGMLTDLGIRVQDAEVEMPCEGGVRLVFHLRMTRHQDGCEVVRRLRAIEGMTAVSWQQQTPET